MARHATKPFSKRLGVTMQAAGADFRTAADRIPRRIRPFDFRFVAHLNQFLTDDRTKAVQGESFYVRGNSSGSLTRFNVSFQNFSPSWCLLAKKR